MSERLRRVGVSIFGKSGWIESNAGSAYACFCGAWLITWLVTGYGFAAMCFGFNLPLVLGRFSRYMNRKYEQRQEKERGA